MNPHRLTLEEFSNHTLGAVMGATGQPGETAQERQTRCAAIVEMFRTFEVANLMEAMIACHCISLHFMLQAAMRDASAADLTPPMQMRLRASATAISKTLHLWMKECTSRHARNEAGTGEAARRTSRSDSAATAAKPQPAAVQSPPPGPQQPRQVAAPRVKPASPFVAPIWDTVSPAFGVADPPAKGKQALLSSVAMPQWVASKGRPVLGTP